MTCCAEASISATSSPRCKAAMLNLPLAAGQPDAAHPAHRCLLAATRPACRNPELESAAAHRVCHDSSASLEDRQPYHRARQPHSYSARLMLPGGLDVQSCRAQAATI